MKNIRELTKGEMWNRVLDFHGHTCGGLAIGFQAARYAIELLDLQFSEDEQVVCIAENDACGIDAIQVLIGCSIGKGNLLFHMTGKQAFTFFNRKTGKSVRIVLLERPKNMSKKDSFEYIMSRDPENLFEIKEAKLKLPVEAKIFDSYPCGSCGEMTGANWIRVKGDEKYCVDCYETYNRFEV